MSNRAVQVIVVLSLLVIGFRVALGIHSGQLALPKPTPTPVQSPTPPDPSTIVVAIHENTPAAEALQAAARKTADAGSFLMKLSASAGTDNPLGAITLDGQGEAASPRRYHIALTVIIAGTTTRSEAIGWDGTFWSRLPGAPWQKTSSDQNNPRGYLNKLNGASNVVDAGPDQHGGKKQEKFTAMLKLSGTQPLAGATASSGQLTAWVDANGYFDGEQVSLLDGVGRQVALFDVELSAFGQLVNVTPPA